MRLCPGVPRCPALPAGPQGGPLPRALHGRVAARLMRYAPTAGPQDAAREKERLLHALREFKVRAGAARARPRRAPGRPSPLRGSESVRGSPARRLRRPARVSPLAGMPLLSPSRTAALRIVQCNSSFPRPYFCVRASAGGALCVCACVRACVRVRACVCVCVCVQLVIKEWVREPGSFVHRARRARACARARPAALCGRSRTHNAAYPAGGAGLRPRRNGPVFWSAERACVEGARALITIKAQALAV